MARLPAECNICGAKFPAPINVSPGTQVHISRVQVHCPYCMSMAAGVPDGVYEVVNEITEGLLSAPSPRLLRELKRVALEAQDRNLSADEFLDKVSKGTPAYRGLSSPLQQAKPERRLPGRGRP
jgi:hypothetical protein